MASKRTLDKRMERSRTWKITTLCPDGVWRQQPYNLHPLSQAVGARKIRLPGKAERLARQLAATKGPSDGEETEDAQEPDAHAG